MDKTLITQQEMLNRVKKTLMLDTEDHDQEIEDLIGEVCDYCNLDRDKIPEPLETHIRKKTKGILDYEKVYGQDYRQDIVSIKEGDGTVTYATGSGNSRQDIYQWTDKEKGNLKKYRRLRYD